MDSVHRASRSRQLTTTIALIAIFMLGLVRIGLPVSILPEVSTRVDFSSSDVNRIVCPGPIQDVIFSQEKGVIVKIVDRNAFVKLQAIQKPFAEEPEYTTTPTELYVVCEGDVYSLIAIPKRIPAQTVRLSSGVQKRIRQNMTLFRGLPYEARVIQLIRAMYTEVIPESFTVSIVREPVVTWGDPALRLQLHRIVRVEGQGLTLREWIVQALGATPITLQETLFLRPSLTRHPLAICIVGPRRLQTNQTARIFIVEREPNVGTTHGLLE